MMNELFEFITDLDLDKPVGDSRSFRELAAFAQECNEKNGRRARDLVLPPNWNIQGLGKADLSGGKVLVFFPCVCAEPLHLGQYDHEVDKGLEVSFLNNFSKVRAIVTLKVGARSLFKGNVLQMFTEMKASGQRNALRGVKFEKIPHEEETKPRKAVKSEGVVVQCVAEACSPVAAKAVGVAAAFQTRTPAKRCASSLSETSTATPEPIAGRVRGKATPNATATDNDESASPEKRREGWRGQEELDGILCEGNSGGRAWLQTSLAQAEVRCPALNFSSVLMMRWVL